MLLTAATVVSGREVFRPGRVEIDGDRVVAIGLHSPDRPADLDLGEVIIVPGFVDIHVHGGGGGAFPTGDPAQARTAVGMHRRAGTTTMIASLVTAAPDALLSQASALGVLAEEGVIAGIHLEGPWLSPRQGGAHELSQLRVPDTAEFDRVFAAAGGRIAMVTIAPELPNALDLIRRVVAVGAVAAVGHTDATYDQARAAIDAGATVATHLFNAMRPVHHREPGPVIALVEDERVTVELITDGVHLHPALYREVALLAGPDRVALVTDAMAAAGMPDGAYRLGALDVTVADGVATLTGASTIAGSTATMEQVFGYAVRNANLPFIDAVLAASRQTSVNPANALSLPGVGSLAPGSFADLVVLDADLATLRVMRRGRWCR